MIQQEKAIIQSKFRNKLGEPPGSTVAITTANSEVTTVTNVTELGEYTFQLTGTCPDGSVTAIDIVKYKHVLDVWTKV